MKRFCYMKSVYLVLLTLLTSLLVSTTVWSKVSIQRSGNQVTYRFSVDRLDFEKVQFAGQSFQKPVLAGLDDYSAATAQVGYPELPVIRFYVSDAQNISVWSGDLKLGVMKSALNLFPKQPPMIKTKSKSDVVVMNSVAYKQNKFWPTKTYEVNEAGSIRGSKRKLITLYPFVYNVSTKQYQIRDNFKVVVDQKPMTQTASGSDVMVFIVGSRFQNSPSLANYAQFKGRLGYDVEYLNVAAGQRPEQIREALKAIYSRVGNRLKYAMIVGDSDDVPGKYATHITGVTDHFYRAIDTDVYEEDLNGPDIGVGRVSVNSEEQLAGVLDKYIKYQVGQFSNESWLNNITFIGTDDRYQIAEGTHNYVIDTYTASRGYLGDFPNANQPGGDKAYAITYSAKPEKVNELMGKGRVIVNYSGHGSNTSWAGPNISQDDVRALSDPDARPFVIGNACITGDFTVPESFGETWERHPYGAITYWGSMDSSFWDEDDILERRMYDGIYRDNLRTFGDITNYALSEVWRQYEGQGRSAYYWETYTTFGDPSIELRTSYTQVTKAVGPSVITVGQSEVQYTIVDQNDRPLSRIRVVLSVGNHHVAAMTDEYGVANFDIHEFADEPADGEVVVYGDNTRTVSMEVKLLPADGPFLVAKDFYLNGRPNPEAFVGEKLNLTFNIYNLGIVDTKGGQIWIDSVKGPAKVSSDRVFVPAIAKGTSVPASGLSLTVNSNAELNQVIQVVIGWSTAEGKSGIRNFNIGVQKAKLEVVAVDNLGGIYSGQSGIIHIKVKNTGTETIHQAQLMTEGKECIESMTNSIFIDQLAPGETKELTDDLKLTISSQCRNGQLATFNVLGDYLSVSSRPSLSAAGSFSSGVIVVREIDNKDLNVKIPDNSEILYPIEVTNQGMITDLSVHFEIAHTYVGDLIVSLVHPDGTEVVLRSRRGSNEHNVSDTYGFDGTALEILKKLFGKDATGKWNLKIRDSAPRDEGTLNRLTLKLKGYLD